MNTTVKVALRVRPLTLQEQINNCAESISYVPNEPQIGIVGSDKSFTFDYVFDETTKQRQVYENCAKDLVERFIEGFNATILAYGQTGSGKTYSMGTGHQYQQGDEAIVPRAAEAIFAGLNSHKEKDPNMDFQVYVSFLELYNEELIDLFQTQPRKGKDTIQVREDGFGGISWHGVKEVQVTSAQEILEWLQKGSTCRTTAATDMNSTSSRSHAIFSVTLKQQRSEELEPITEAGADEEAGTTTAVTKNDKPVLKKLNSKFHFVDLAGSERLKRTRAVGDRAKEGISINAGLLALGNVISALGDESRRSSHIPYRDSKLTRLLQDSLGGNSATLMLACVSASDADLNETISTLVYANRARNIRNRVVVNHDYNDSSSAEVAKLRAEVNRLKMENSAFRAMGVGRLRERLNESNDQLITTLAERDTLLVEREVTGDSNIEAHPIMATYHRTVMQLKDRLIAAEDQALELQTLLTQKQTSVFGRRPQATSPRRKGASPFRKRLDHLTTDDDHDADGEQDGRKDGSPARLLLLKAEKNGVGMDMDPQDTKVFFEAEQKAAETLANAMKAMHRFSFPLSGDSLSISQQQQQSRLNAAIQLQKAAGVPLPDSDSGSLVDTASLVGSISGRSGRSARFATAPSVDFSIAIQSERSRHSRQSGQSGRSGNSGSNRSGPQDGDTLISEARRLSEAAVAAVDNEELANKLERAEMEIHKLQMHYQQEIHVLEDRIREAEIEHTNKLPGTAKVKYEAKIKQLMTQLSDLEHKYNEVSKVANEKRSANESQLKSLRTTVETLKLEKQRMIKRMKEDAERLKEINAANDRELQALRRAEKAASEARKKAESELQQQQQQLQQQQRNAAMHRSTGSSSTQQAKMNGLLKKPQTPKGISKAPKRGAPRMASPERAPEPPKKARKGSVRMQVSQKKQVIDRAIYGYISGQHTINVMEDLLRKRQRLRNEKQELEQERERVVLAQEESAMTNGTDPLDFASEPQYMDDRISMIDAEVAYINARIRALQAEAAALGFVTTIEKVGDSDGADEEELMTKLIRQGMANDAMGLPPGSGAVGAFESSLQILRSLDVNEAREFVEMLFEDIVSVRTNENALYVQATNQEKVIEELKRALQTMRQ
ncbi:MAG: P-loop containing nucleoside triphosphate hydrolase protein, partial [Benniella sp.]